MSRLRRLRRPRPDEVGGSCSTGIEVYVCFREAAARHAMAGHEGFVLSTGFSPDRGQIISIGDDRTMRIWRVSLPEGKA